MLAVGTLSHALLAGVRRRYRDLALLKALGLVRSQLLRVVCWQATALAAASLLAGVPLGVLAGRWAWAVFAWSAGVAIRPNVPVPLVLAAIPATVLLANLIAVGPGWTAAGSRRRRHYGASDGSTSVTLRAGLRRRWRHMLGLALLLGVIGGVVLTAAAGACAPVPPTRGSSNGPGPPSEDHCEGAALPAGSSRAGPAPAGGGDATTGLFHSARPVRGRRPLPGWTYHVQPGRFNGPHGRPLKVLAGQLSIPGRRAP